jgi:hypothetical protein
MKTYVMINLGNVDGISFNWEDMDNYIEQCVDFQTLMIHKQCCKRG